MCGLGPNRRNRLPSLNTCITEPYAQLRALRGMQVLDPQNSPAVEQGHEPTVPPVCSGTAGRGMDRAARCASP